MKNFLLPLLVGISLFAQSNVEQNFESQGGEITPELKKLISTDLHFNKAVEYLENPSMMQKIKRDFKDVENPNAKPLIVEQTLPNYVEAFKSFKKSVEHNGNAISAYQGLHLIKTVYGKSTNLKDFKNFSKILYAEQKNICSAYIDYGESIEKGYFTKADKNKALEIYSEGLENKKCQQGWYFNVLGAKAESLKRALK